MDEWTRKRFAQPARVGEPRRYDDAAGLRVLAFEDGVLRRWTRAALSADLHFCWFQNFIERFASGEARSLIVASFEQWLRDNRDLHTHNAGPQRRSGGSNRGSSVKQ